MVWKVSNGKKKNQQSNRQIARRHDDAWQLKISEAQLSVQLTDRVVPQIHNNHSTVHCTTVSSAIGLEQFIQPVLSQFSSGQTVADCQTIKHKCVILLE